MLKNSLLLLALLSQLLIAETPPPPKEKPIRLSPTKFCLTRTYLNSVGTDLNQLLQSADANPEINAAKTALLGFRFNVIHKGSEILALGIKKGDLVTGFDQIKFENAAQPFVAFQTLRQGGPTSPDEEHALKILRQGKALSLTYQIKTSCK
jgi:S1-C subfamily serine protease